MSENVAVDVLLAVGVGSELACCVGVVAVRTVFDRLHFAAAASTVGPILILVALLVREGFSAEGLQAIVAVALLLLATPVLVHALARAARRVDYGGLEPLPGEKVRA